MVAFDVFNGDADGLCALHQLRLAEPLEAQLVTGTKRDNRLLHRVAASAGDVVTVCDIALRANREALVDLLRRGVSVRYFDHHVPGDVPIHALFQAYIDTAPEVCTSVIVDRLLQGRHRAWAVVGAFGDNLAATATRLAATLEVSAPELAQWRELGECLNYNAYGESEADLFIPPAELFRLLQRYRAPQAFIDGEPVFHELRDGRVADMAMARAIAPEAQSRGASVHILPEGAWARRVMGSFANALAQEDPRRAHAVLVPNGRAGFALSLRVPHSGVPSAHDICREFGGGGRGPAAGVNDLAEADLAPFVKLLLASYDNFGGRA
jgi:hypothetical protein